VTAQIFRRTIKLPQSRFVKTAVHHPIKTKKADSSYALALFASAVLQNGAYLIDGCSQQTYKRYYVDCIKSGTLQAIFIWTLPRSSLGAFRKHEYEIGLISTECN
jgi:hypothetical protein